MTESLVVHPLGNGMPVDTTLVEGKVNHIIRNALAPKLGPDLERPLTAIDPAAHKRFCHSRIALEIFFSEPSDGLVDPLRAGRESSSQLLDQLSARMLTPRQQVHCGAADI